MRIAIIVEGKTEKVFIPVLRKFLETRLAGNMPKIMAIPYDGRIPKGEKLKRIVFNLMQGGNAYDHVIAVTDVYTGSQDFDDANDAKKKMREWIGEDFRFHPHVALHDFESWLLPYWDEIQKLSGCMRNAPGKHPEKVNHGKPPAHHISEMFEIETCRDSYVKPRDAKRILDGKDLSISISECLELKYLVNTILEIMDGPIIQ